MIADNDRQSDLGREINELRDCRDGLRAHFARIKINLIDERLARFDDVCERLDAQIKRLEMRRDDQRRQVDELRRAVADNGGNRIEHLITEIRRLEGVRDSRRLKFERYVALAKRVGEAMAADERDFIAQRMHLKTLRNEARDRDATLQNELTEHHVAFRQSKLDHDVLLEEIEHLKRRRSNIDAEQVHIRAALCDALGIAEDEMPFAGELLQIREEDKDWEGAAERLLRSFGLSLLVPDAYYKEVADWVERTHLGGRLVFLHVHTPHRGEPLDLHRDSILRKLAIKPDSPHYDWMTHELAHRFDMACCATQEQFRTEARAITLAGLIKDSGSRYEKDDRLRIDDRSRDVLGWDNAAKIAALESRSAQLDARVREIGDRLGRLQDQRKLLGEQLDAFSRLEEFVEFEDLDWGTVASEITALMDERRALETASDLLPRLNDRLVQSARSLATIEKELDIAKDRRARIQQHKVHANEMRRLAQAVIEQAATQSRLLAPDELASRLDQARSEALCGSVAASIEVCDHQEQETRAYLERRIEAMLD